MALLNFKESRNLINIAWLMIWSKFFPSVISFLAVYRWLYSACIQSLLKQNVLAKKTRQNLTSFSAQPKKKRLWDWAATARSNQAKSHVNCKILSHFKPGCFLILNTYCDDVPNVVNPLISLYFVGQEERTGDGELLLLLSDMFQHFHCQRRSR